MSSSAATPPTSATGSPPPSSPSRPLCRAASHPSSPISPPPGDAARMLNSADARAPARDREVTAFGLALPLRDKVRGLTVKPLLRQAARAWLPRAVVERRKRGLSVPVAGWINAGLRAEVDRLLEPGRLTRQGILDAPRVGQLLAEHRAGRANHARPLWAALVLERFLER